MKLGLWGAAIGLVVLGAAALFIGSASTVKGIWQVNGSQLEAANTAAGGTPTPPGATTPAEPDEPAVVKLVRNGVLQNYKTTTVGKAFEGTFQDPKWTTFVSSKGATVVQFDGTISPKAIREAGFGNPGGPCSDARLTRSDEACRIPVTIQFTILLDKKSFEISSIDQNAFLEDHQYQYEELNFAGQPVRKMGGTIDPAEAEKVLEFIYR